MAAIVTEDEVRDYLNAAGSGDGIKIFRIIDRWSAIIEAYLERSLIVPTSDYVEFHPQRLGQWIGSELMLLDWPVSSITTVHEDSQRDYGATSLLVQGTDYLVDSGPTGGDWGKLIRLDGGDPVAWDNTYRAVRVAYKAGYADVDAIPQDIKEVALREIAISYQEIVNKMHGVSTKTDATGNVTRFYHSHLSDRSKAELEKYRNVRHAVPTGTRAA